MELEDKQLEGRDLDRELQLENERDIDELPVVVEDVVDVELAHRGKLYDALQLILADAELAVSQLGLPQRETAALEALQTAVAGRDPMMGTFVYAEDRQRLLEQALAVLQQNIAIDPQFEQLSDRVGELREELAQLEDAQDDEFEQREPVVVSKPADEPPEDESLTDFIASALLTLAELPHQSSLDGPEPKVVKPPSSLDGPDVVVEKPPSSLDGPEPKVAKPPSSLDGPEVIVEKPPSTLSGPERPEPVKPKSTLGVDPAIVPAVLHQPAPRKSSPTIDPPKRPSAPSIPPPKGKRRG